MSDVMFLVALTAVGLVLAKVAFDNNCVPNVVSNLEWWPSSYNWPNVLGFLADWVYLAAPVIAVWSVGLGLIALRRPRPSIRRLSRQPGFLGCWVATVAMVLVAVQKYASQVWWASQTTIDPDFASYVVYDALGPMAYSVLAAWISIALGRGWRFSAGWIEVTQRTICLVWISWLVLSEFLG